jgi:SAM-dependent methyltransferase
MSKKNGINPSIGCNCDGQQKIERICFREKPDGETNFGINREEYLRFYDQCLTCKHWFGRHNIDISNLYSGDYVAATYGANLKAIFVKIVNLDSSKSDNANRALRGHNFYNKWQKLESALTILDVGSGTGVFPYAMKNLGWICTAIDPDPIACEHIERRLKIQTICGDFFNLDLEKIGKFSLISFNKVLEHIENPIEMLVTGKELLSQKGIIYIEVPDGDSAFRANPAHEEFFIEHHHAFSISSLSLMIERSGLNCLEISRIVEPSGKYTIYCFASKVK